MTVLKAVKSYEREQDDCLFLPFFLKNERNEVSVAAEGSGPGWGKRCLRGELGTGRARYMQSPTWSSQAPENLWTSACSTQWSSLPCLTSPPPPHCHTLPFTLLSTLGSAPASSPHRAPGLVPSPSLCLSLRTLPGPVPSHHDDELAGFLAADDFPLCHLVEGDI